MGAHLPGDPEADRRRARSRGRDALAASAARPMPGGDFFGAFDEWYGGSGTCWPRRSAAGASSRGEPAHVCASSRSPRAGREILRQTDLQHGEVVENRELVDMSKPRRAVQAAYRDPPAGRHDVSRRRLPVGAAAQPAAKCRARAAPLRLRARQPASCCTRATAATTSAADRLPVSVGELLPNYVELAQPATRAQVAALAEADTLPAGTAAAASAWPSESRTDAEVLDKRASVLDLLERFPACELPFGAFLEMLPPMRARQYSISSSPLWDDTRCTLTIACRRCASAVGAGALPRHWRRPTSRTRAGRRTCRSRCARRTSASIRRRSRRRR